MKKFKSTLKTVFTWASWIVIILNALFLVFQPYLLDDKKLGKIYLYSIAFWLIGSSLIAATALIMHYKKFFANWIGWLIPFFLMFPYNLISAKIIPVSHPGIVSLFAVIGIVSMWCLGVTTFVYVKEKDVGLRLMALGSIAFVWAVFLGWKYQGNLLVLSSTNKDALWWLWPIIFLFFWAFVVGIPGYLWHTVRLLKWEFGKK